MVVITERSVMWYYWCQHYGPLNPIEVSILAPCLLCQTSTSATLPLAATRGGLKLLSLAASGVLTLQYCRFLYILIGSHVIIS